MFDDINSGQVNYSNYLQSPVTTAPISSPINVYKSSSGDGIRVNWSSNLETDLSGYKIYYNPIDEFSYANSIDVGNVTSYIIDGLNLSDTIVITAYDNETDGTNDLYEGHESWYSQPAQQCFTSDILSGNSYCQGNEIEYQIDVIADFKNDNNFIIQLSDTSGSFDNPINLFAIDTSESINISTSFPDTLIFSEEYLIRVKSTNPEAYSNYNTITFYQIPTATFALDTQKLCGSDTVLISYTGTGSEIAIYNWNFYNGNIISGSGQGDYEVNWNVSGTKNVNLSVSENGCTSETLSMELNVYQIPTSQFSIPSYVCDTNHVTVSYLGNAADTAHYFWNFNNGNIISGSGQGDYEINWNSIGEKYVSLLVEENGCFSDTTINNVSVNYIPTSTFNLDTQKLCGSDTVLISYTGTGSENATYSWNFNSGNVISSDQVDYKVNWNTQGIKNISLSVTENGCTSNLTSDIVRNCFDFIY